MFNFYINADLAEVKREMSELNDKVEGVIDLLKIEATQVDAIKTELADIKAKLDTLVMDTYAKAEVNAALDKIAGLIPGVVPDEPAPEPPAE